MHDYSCMNQKNPSRANVLAQAMLLQVAAYSAYKENVPKLTEHCIILKYRIRYQDMIK